MYHFFHSKPDIHIYKNKINNNMTSITFILVILLFLLSFTLSSSITNNNDNIYQYEHLINNFFSNEFVKIPGTYMTENYRNDNNNFVNDFNLNSVPTYNINHKTA